MHKAAQFSFAADLFMLQAILRTEDVTSIGRERAFIFPMACYNQIVGWLLENPQQIGLTPFEGINVEFSPGEARVTFPSEEEEDKMHRFFEMFNRNRQQAVGVDPTFPPMPDVYQGQSQPQQEIIDRYIQDIYQAFAGEADWVEVPTGPNQRTSKYNCY